MPLKAVSNHALQQQESIVHAQQSRQPFESKIAINALLRSVQVRSFRHRSRISSTHSGILVMARSHGSII